MNEEFILFWSESAKNKEMLPPFEIKYTLFTVLNV